jgi:hypothetical protein
MTYENALEIIESEFDTIKQGDKYVCGNGANEYAFETVDGDIFVKKLS